MAEVASERSRTMRTIYTGLGVVFLAVALVGIFLPLVPTTITTIVAGYFFAKGSERFDLWLTEHRVLGPIINDYRAGLGFTVRAKTIAVTAITVSISLSTWWALSQGAPVGVGVFMAMVWAYAIWFVLHQPTRSTQVPVT